MTIATNRICQVCKLPYLAHVNPCGLTKAVVLYSSQLTAALTTEHKSICARCGLPAVFGLQHFACTALPWQGPRSNTFLHGLAGLRVAYPVTQWDKSEAWNHLRWQQIPGCPVVVHGWQKDHVYDAEWAWVYIGSRT